MQIYTNIASLTVQRNLGSVQSDMNRTLQRLSSGQRVNSASDDAAGLAIGERMRAQINGNNQAIRNANDGVSMLQIAESALASTNTVLQRIRELAVQANNSTLSDKDKEALQAEVNQNLQEIDRIARDTQFNGQKLFSQDISSIGGDVNRRAVTDALRIGWLEQAEQRIKTYYGIEADGALTMDVNLNFTDGAGGALASVSTTAVGGDGKWQNITLNVDMADFTPPNLPKGGNAPIFDDRVIAHEMTHAEMSRAMNFAALPTWFKEGTAEFMHGAKERVAGDVAAAGSAANLVTGADIANPWVNDSAHYSVGYSAVRYLHDKLKALGVSGGIKGVMVYLSQNAGSTLDTALNAVTGGTYANTAAFLADWDANGANYINANVNISGSDTGAIGGKDADGGQIITAANIFSDYGTKYGDNVLEGFKLNIPGHAYSTSAVDYSFMVGANANQSITTQMDAFNSSRLGISDTDLTKLPTYALVHVDEAIEYVNQQRAKIGAMMSRLDSAVSALSSNVVNTSAARSRIIDTDYAQETAQLTRKQILQQAAGSMLVQANSSQQLALSLLR